jgi:hypothetical protein
VLSLNKVVRTFGTEDHEEGRYVSWLRCVCVCGGGGAEGDVRLVRSCHIRSCRAFVLFLHACMHAHTHTQPHSTTPHHTTPQHTTPHRIKSHHITSLPHACSRLYQVGLRQATGYGMFVASGHIACYMTKVQLHDVAGGSVSVCPHIVHNALAGWLNAQHE